MTEASDAPEPGPAGMLARTTAAAAGAGLGLAVGGPAGAVIGAAAGPALEHAFGRAGSELLAWRRDAAMSLLANASEQLKVSPDELVSRATDDPARAQLLAESMFAAARTVNEQKVKALARALANGLRDDQARPDEQLLIVAALSQLEEAHVKVLTHLGPERFRSSPSSTLSRTRTPRRTGVSVTAVADSAGLTPPSARSALSVLQRAGMAALDNWPEVDRADRMILELQIEVSKLGDLLTNPPRNGKVPSSKRPKKIKKPGRLASPGWAITEFGEVCLAHLEGGEVPESWEADEYAADLEDGGDEYDADEYDADDERMR